MDQDMKRVNGDEPSATIHGGRALIALAVLIAVLLLIVGR
jgi:hypothetical protein